MTTYGEAGVDLEGADRHVEAIANPVTATWTENVIGNFGGFAAGVTIPAGYREPVLMMSTDGVGTKLELARRAGRWDGVGQDLVAMCVDDLAAVGARPLGFVDYLAVGALNATRDRAIVESVAAACAIAGCPLLGGETAEHPGVMEPDAVDLAGAVMGIVERGQDLGPTLVTEGDVVVGLTSPNLRSNGFSLVRALFGDEIESQLDRFLEPSVIYSPDVLRAVEGGGVRAAAHITGGGLAGNLARVLPPGMGAHVDTGAWEVPPVFETIASRGAPDAEMWSTFNMGIGFCLVVTPDAAESVISTISAHEGRVIGEIVVGEGVALG
ncbi:MAG TPA: phosphoribosylformylglycinamidine cyclo-ligase [Acidimicrobiia bacterium]|jgi:phosphoribosylformylglycinamidine cyclo-ligase|nr:phosphoribosylformylglycinamidine cyclo-ligase [Acidimicrobiia bacterium]